MTNWRMHKTVSMFILIMGAILLLGILGVDINSKVIGTFTWMNLIGVGLIYVLWAFNRLINV